MSPLDLLKQVGGPGSIGFLAVGCAVGLLLIHVWPKRRALGRIWLFTLYASYIVLGVPVVAHAIAAPFAGVRPLDDDALPRSLDALMVFGGDNAVARVQETLRVWNAAWPPTVIVSGEEWFVERIVEEGVPADRIVRDETSGTTRQQIEYLKAYLRGRERARVAIIASRLQVPRVEALARSAGLQVTIVPSAVDREPADRGLGLFVPTYAALRVSRDAFYERLALAYYRRQGWIEGGDQ